MTGETYVFSRTGRLLDVIQPERPPRYFLGLDLGQAADYSALSLVQQTITEKLPDEDKDVCRFDVVGLKRWPLGTSYPAIVVDVQGILKRSPLPEAKTDLVIDGTGVGRPVVDLFKLAGMRPIPITITGGNQVTREHGYFNVPKRDLVAVLRVAQQTGRLKVAGGLAEGATLTKEMQSFEIKISDAGHDSYGSWREGSHDDLVLSLAVAVWYGEWAVAHVWRAY